MKFLRKNRIFLGFAAVTAVALAIGCGTRGDDAESASQDLVGSPDLVISQVYGGGGNANATFSHDYVELFNRGTAPAKLDGKFLHYTPGSAPFSNAKNFVTLPKATIEPGHYYLVQLAKGPKPAPALPKADLVTSGTEAVPMAGDNGKVALVTTLLDGCGTDTACPAASILDLVGYGSASASESAPSGALSSILAATRRNGGCADTDNNSADFTPETPAPHTGELLTANKCAPGPASVDAPDAAKHDATTSSDAGAPAKDGSAEGGATAPSSDGGAAADGGPKPKDGGGGGAEAGTKKPKEAGAPAPSGAGDDDDDSEETPEGPPPSSSGTPSTKPSKKGTSTGSANEATGTRPPSLGATSPDCAMKPGSNTAPGSGLALLGLGLGLALAARKRRRG